MAPAADVVWQRERSSSAERRKSRAGSKGDEGRLGKEFSLVVMMDGTEEALRQLRGLLALSESSGETFGVSDLSERG
jgi:hypothetical protein